MWFHWCFRLKLQGPDLHPQTELIHFSLSCWQLLLSWHWGVLSITVRFEITLNICCAELLITRIFFLACLLQGQSTCPCCGGSCPQPCFTAPSERSKFSTETWEYGWKMRCISKSCSSSAGRNPPAVRSTQTLQTNSLWQPNRLQSVANVKWNICFKHPLRGLNTAHIPSCVKQEGCAGSITTVLYILTDVEIHCFLVGEHLLFSCLWSGRVRAFSG